MVSRLSGTKNHNANVFHDQLLCQDDSATDIPESFNEVTVARNSAAQAKMCAF